MQGFIKNERGVSLISLATAIIILGIIISMLLYNVKDTKDTERVSNLYIDIEGITDRVSNYYSRYGALPVLRNIDLSSDSTINEWISELQSENNEGPLGANDTGNFYVIDMNALENLSLNYGSGFNRESLPDDKDVYVINENSHNIFYLHGIKVTNNGVVKIYYTNQKKDVEKVSIQYVDEIKIPDGFVFKSGDTRNNLKIEKIVTGGTNIEYTWANTGDNVYQMTKKTVNDATEYHLIFGNTMDSKIIFDTTNGQNADDLIASAKEFGGFYYTPGTAENTVNVYYFSVSEDDNWGMPYGKEGVYIDKNGDRAYIPQGFRISKLSSLNTINKGLVIKKYVTDAQIQAGDTGDEYVWIDVPDNVLANARTLEEIENALKEYTKDYRAEGYEDTYLDGLVMTNDETKNNKVVYNELKNKMLQSIKQNGGFYIGRYEAGKDDNNNLVCQKEKKTYNFITVGKAQDLADNGTNENYTTSLMFGIQWDLICKFIEETGAKSYSEIAVNSIEWGNYTSSSIDYVYDNTNYNKPAETQKLLKTGSSIQTKVLNIFDLAGNQIEFTLEKAENNRCVLRGGGYQSQNSSLISYTKLGLEAKYSDCGFRVTLFKTPPETATSSN
ncbi:MAG: hypothetical protein J5881_02365 [Clostridia bacterium]|nr:hypothetical protein [Clostridia bacterium]